MTRRRTARRPDPRGAGDAPHRHAAGPSIVVRGARQNNLKGIDVDLPLGAWISVSGPSGSGKSSLALDTLYAEGQRRYVESFSPYARQFLERLDRPRVDRVEGVPPAIAIEPRNPVRTSRSTVATATDVADFLKLLFARTAELRCTGCGRGVRRDTPESVLEALESTLPPGSLLWIAFPHAIQGSSRAKRRRAAAVAAERLAGLGFHRAVARGETVEIRALGDADEAKEWAILVDRVPLETARRGRVLEAFGQAFEFGRGRLSVFAPFDGAGSGPVERRFSRPLHCPECDRPYPDPHPNLFSFNSPVGACPRCKGFGRTIEIDPELVVPNPALSIDRGAIKPWSGSFKWEARDLRRFCRRRGIPMDSAWKHLPTESREAIWEGDDSFDGLRKWFRWLESRTYRMHIRVLLSRYRAYVPCPECGGGRLNPLGLAWKVRGKSLGEVMSMNVAEALAFFEAIDAAPEGDEGRNSARATLLREILSRLRMLRDVGLHYLALDRPARTLSGGEAQRVALTGALGASLVNVLYVLDEPSVGLHARDTDRLVRTLAAIRDAGNTVLVVEHDPALLRAADLLADLGPGSGERGGELLYLGPPAEIAGEPRSVTGPYLAGGRELPAPARRRESDPNRMLRLFGAAANNLRDLDVEIPLGLLVCVSGVSGSGKSTLVEEVLHPAMLRALGLAGPRPGRHRALEGASCVRDVALVDQSPAGKSSRANVATYVGAYDRVRRLLAGSREARRAGLTASSFSFNVQGGRCETCKGEGSERIEMQFLSDVRVTCPECRGRRFRAHVLEARVRGKNAVEILDLTVDDAAAFFAPADGPARRGDAAAVEIASLLDPLRRVGLGYLRLGQSLATLSGGEAQRLKLAEAIGRARSSAGNGRAAKSAAAEGAEPRSTVARGRGTLFFLDEPTVGLHLDDVRKLLEAFEALLAAGDSLVVVEHHVGVIRSADWVVDLGPEAGEGGGRVVAAGPPEAIAACADSHTGAALRAAGVVASRRNSSRSDSPRSGGVRLE